MAITLPSETQPIWDELHAETVWLHWHWSIYCDLFASSPRVDLLNQCASTFFGVLQGTLLDAVQLTLSRLGDPAETRKNRNLTLATLTESLSTDSDTHFVTRLRTLLSAYQAKSAQVRTRRNKKIAHSDYETLLGGATSALPGPSRQEIDEILGALREFMNAIAERFGKTQIFYQASTPDAAAPALLMILKAGLRYRELWNDEGKWLEDLQKSPYFSV